MQHKSFSFTFVSTMAKKRNIPNPFLLKGYHSPELFCDRDQELENLIENITQKRDVTLFAMRRVGKTGLIRHLFHHIKKDFLCIYLDIYSTQNHQEFIRQLASAIFNALPKKKQTTDKFIEYIRSFNPSLSFDPLTGLPELSLQANPNISFEKSISKLFAYLEGQNKSVVIAIDEFQQVAEYPENNTEAALRTIIQNLQNTNFIFCGSNKHLIHEMFNNAKRPFFASTQPLYLDRIDFDIYKAFIVRQFIKHRKKITEEAVEFILNWTRRHTFYTQVICNKVFYYAKDTEVQLSEVQLICDGTLKEQEGVFYQYRNLLTSSQWDLLAAIAKEGRVFQPTGVNFVSKYNLGNASSVRRSLKSLLDKEMVVELNEEDTSFYSVYDCFLQRWLSKLK